MAIPLDPERKAYLEALFPQLARRRYSVRAAPDKKYNCIAWAVGSTSECWWPDTYALLPIRERRVTVSCFGKLLESQGFKPAADATIEAGYAKVALFVSHGVPTHTAHRIRGPLVEQTGSGRTHRTRT